LLGSAGGIAHPKGRITPIFKVGITAGIALGEMGFNDQFALRKRNLIWS
jgi:hypothetical protein